MEKDCNELPEIDFSCPFCGQNLNSPDDMGGQIINCPVCNKQFQIPGGTIEPPISQPFPTFMTPIGGEKVLAVARPSGFYFLGKYLFGTLCFLFGIVGGKTQSPLAAWGVLAAVFGVIYLLWTTGKMLLFIYSYLYVMTNLRVVSKKGLVSISTREVRIADIRGVNLRQGLLERLLNVGSIAIASAATAGIEISFFGIKNPRDMLALINSQRKA